MEHDRHVHVVYKSSPQNSMRNLNEILQQCEVDEDQIQACRNSKQLGRNIVAMLGYMKSRGFVMHISQLTVELEPSIPTPWHICYSIPSEDRRAIVREQRVARLRDRESRIHQLLEIVRERDLQYFQDLNKKFSTNERASMLVQLGVTYRAMVQNCIDIIRAERIHSFHSCIATPESSE
ncbi:hypothetical protein Aperf_G00000021740 [Anoplocephala perfoliata]